jgi:methionyl-tRNA formyltransferase
MKKILVVSENVGLCSFLVQMQKDLALSSKCSFDFRYTSYNNNPQSMLDFGACEINVKDESVIDWIVRNYDIVFSLHCKQIFPASLVSQILCFNFHPGYNPYNRGWYPQAFSLINGLPIGATVHRMDEQIDHGGIVAQKKVNVLPKDTSLDVYNNVIKAEKKLIREHLISIIDNTYTLSSPIEEGNYNDIKDYMKLCQLNLDEVGTLESHLNLLRGLSHSDFRNAYYEKDGKKYFVKIIISD